MTYVSIHDLADNLAGAMNVDFHQAHALIDDMLSDSIENEGKAAA